MDDGLVDCPLGRVLGAAHGVGWPVIGVSTAARQEGSLQELLAVVPGARVAVLDTRDEPAVAQRAAQLGWGVRHYAGQIACLLPHEASLRSVVDAFTEIDVSGVSLQSVSLEHVYLEVIHYAAARH